MHKLACKSLYNLKVRISFSSEDFAAHFVYLVPDSDYYPRIILDFQVLGIFCLEEVAMNNDYQEPTDVLIDDEEMKALLERLLTGESPSPEEIQAMKERDKDNRAALGIHPVPEEYLIDYQSQSSFSEFIPCFSIKHLHYPLPVIP